MSSIAHIALPLSEEFQEVVLDQQGTTKYAHDLEDRPVQLEVVFDDGDKTICDDGDVDLYSHSILAVTPESLDTEMLLNPFEEKFDLPTVTVEQGNVFCGKVEVVGVIYERATEVSSVIDNPSYGGGVVPCVSFSRESDSLVEEYTVLPVKHILSVDNFNLRFSLLPDDEECSTEMYSEKPCEVEIPPVKNVAGIGFIFNPVHSLAVADFGICDSVEYGYLSDDVNLGMDFDARLCAAKECPAEDGHAEVDGCRIDSIETSVKFEFLCDSPSLCKRHHIEGKLLEDAWLSKHIGLGKRIPDNRRCAESKVIRSFRMSCCDVCKFSKASASEKLSEHKHQQLIPMSKAPSQCPVVIFIKNSPKLSSGQKLYNLCENVVSCMHNLSKYDLDTNILISNV